MRINNQKAPKTKRTLLISIVIIVLATLGYVVFSYTNDIWPFTTNKPAQNNSESAETLNKNTAADDDRADESNKKDQDEALKEGNKIQGKHDTAGSGVTDNNGEGVTDTGGIISKSGDLTLFSPTKNQEISSGITVTGKSKSNNLHYRMSTSDQQIALGELSVVNGKFSGNIVVNGVDSGENGTFEVFNFNSKGQEINNIRIDVVF